MEGSYQVMCQEWQNKQTTLSITLSETVLWQWQQIAQEHNIEDDSIMAAFLVRHFLQPRDCIMQLKGDATQTKGDMLEMKGSKTQTAGRSLQHAKGNMIQTAGDLLLCGGDTLQTGRMQTTRSEPVQTKDDSWPKKNNGAPGEDPLLQAGDSALQTRSEVMQTRDDTLWTGHKSLWRRNNILQTEDLMPQERNATLQTRRDPLQASFCYNCSSPLMLFCSRCYTMIPRPPNEVMPVQTAMQKEAACSDSLRQNKPLLCTPLTSVPMKSQVQPISTFSTALSHSSSQTQPIESQVEPINIFSPAYSHPASQFESVKPQMQSAVALTPTLPSVQDGASAGFSRQTRTDNKSTVGSTVDELAAEYDGETDDEYYTRDTTNVGLNERVSIKSEDIRKGRVRHHLGTETTSSQSMGQGNESEDKTPGCGHRDVFTCRVCLRIFFNCDRLVVHEQTHRSHMLHQCEKCKARFFQSETLALHVATHCKQGNVTPAFSLAQGDDQERSRPIFHNSKSGSRRRKVGAASITQTQTSAHNKKQPEQQETIPELEKLRSNGVLVAKDGSTVSEPDLVRPSSQTKDFSTEQLDNHDGVELLSDNIHPTLLTSATCDGSSKGVVSGGATLQDSSAETGQETAARGLNHSAQWIQGEKQVEPEESKDQPALKNEEKAQEEEKKVKDSVWSIKGQTYPKAIVDCAEHCYACQQCGASFSQPKSLVSHARAHHHLPGKPWTSPSLLGRSRRKLKKSITRPPRLRKRRANVLAKDPVSSVHLAPNSEVPEVQLRKLGTQCTLSSDVPEHWLTTRSGIVKRNRPAPSSGKGKGRPRKAVKKVREQGRKEGAGATPLPATGFKSTPHFSPQSPSSPDLELDQTSKATHPHVCRFCGDRFASADHLTIHVRDHVGQSVFKCSSCDVTCRSAARLKSHVRTQHTIQAADKDFPCQYCGKVLRSLYTLREHQRSHTGERPFQCRTCGAGFTLSSTYHAHLRTHSGDRPYLCPHCGKSFVRSSNLSVHIRVCTGQKPYSCSVCGKSFADVGYYRKHVNNHAGILPYKCEYCGKAFAQSTSLKLHIRTHTGEKPHQCGQCPMAFAVPNSLQQHMRRHTGDRPYKCSVCGKAFAKSCNRLAHFRTHAKAKVAGSASVSGSSTSAAELASPACMLLPPLPPPGLASQV